MKSISIAVLRYFCSFLSIIGNLHEISSAHAAAAKPVMNAMGRA